MSFSSLSCHCYCLLKDISTITYISTAVFSYSHVSSYSVVYNEQQRRLLKIDIADVAVIEYGINE